MSQKEKTKTYEIDMCSGSVLWKMLIFALPLMFSSILQLLFNAADVIVGSLRGLGYSVMPMIVSLIGACGLRLLWIFTFFRMDAFHTVTSLYMTYPVSWLLTFIAHLICYMFVRRKFIPSV